MKPVTNKSNENISQTEVCRSPVGLFSIAAAAAGEVSGCAPEGSVLFPPAVSVSSTNTEHLVLSSTDSRTGETLLLIIMHRCILNFASARILTQLITIDQISSVARR